MIRLFGRILSLTALLPLIACAAPATPSSPAISATSPTRSDTPTPLEWSIRLANSEMARIGDHFSAKNAKWAYDNFLFFHSLLQLDAQLAQQHYTPWVKQNTDSFLSADGSAITHFKSEDYNIDNIAPGVVLMDLYHQTKDARYRTAIELLRTQLKTHPRTSEGGFWHKNRYPDQMWLDGLFMGSPFYAEYAKTFNEPANFDDVAKQIRLVGTYTYDEKSGLFYHAWDEAHKQDWANKTTGKSPNFWSRAIGWYAMAIVDVLDFVPSDHPKRPEIVAMFNKLAAGLVKHQDPASGLWWQVTDQGPRTGNYLEATASSMFVYSMAKAVNQGTLSRDYLPAIIKGYDGLIRDLVKIDETGQTRLTRCCKVAGLGFGRDGSFEYYIGEPIIDNDTKGTGPFILAGLHLNRLLGNTPARAAFIAPAAPAATQKTPTSVSQTTPDYSRAPWDQVPAILTRIKAPTFPAREFSIIDFGAPTDGKTLATTAIQKAIDACNASGGGTVLVPAGTYLTGAITLKSNVNLHLPEGSKLLFATDPALYPTVFTRWEGVECMNFSPLIYAYGQENIAITGLGTIDGQAGYDNWWGWVKKNENEKLKNPPARPSRDRLIAEGAAGMPVEQRIYGLGHYLRPPLIQPYKCKNVLIEGVTLLRSPFWVIHPVLSENITVRSVKIVSHGPNSDGCDPESCRDILIENTLFDTGDDCIAIKSGRNEDGRRLNVPTENMVIRTSEFKDGHGGVVLGSECSGHIRNIFAENCRMDSPNLDRAFRFKNNAIRGGILENAHMRNVEIGRVAESVLTIDLLYEEGAKGPHQAIVRNVTMDNITSTGSPRVMYIRSFPGAIIDDIRISNSTFAGITHTEVVQHVGRITLENINIIPAKVAKSANTVPAPSAE